MIRLRTTGTKPDQVRATATASGPHFQDTAPGREEMDQRVKVRKGLLTGSAATLVAGLAVAAAVTTIGADEPPTGTSATAAPDRAGSGGEYQEDLSQQPGHLRPKSHRVDRKARPKRASGGPTSESPPTGGSAETRISAYVTGYSYWDNTPPGSSAISHPRVHTVAAGVGTYADPITVAVGHDLSDGSDRLDWPAGTRFYLPYLQRYFVVEDTCGDGSAPEQGPCHTGYPSPATTWLDVWVGGRNADQQASDECMSAITGVHTAIKDPRPDHPVSRGELTDNCATHPE
jgi:hypothetical protein